jgi:hypothetical protein
VRSGLRPGDEVILFPQETLTENARVAPASQ